MSTTYLTSLKQHSFPTRRSSDLAQESRDECRCGLLIDFRRRTELLQLAFVHHGDLVAHRHGLDLIVCDIEHCRSKPPRSEEHTSELQSRQYLVCRLLLEKKNKQD